MLYLRLECKKLIYSEAVLRELTALPMPVSGFKGPDF